MHRAFAVAVAAVLATTAGSVAEEIKGKVTVPAEAADKAKAAGDQQKPSGVVVWVEDVKDAKPPEKKGKLSQKEGQFAPALLVAVAGQTVEFPNDDNIAHNVFSMSATKKFNLGIYPKGESKEVVFEKPGIIDVFCSLHRNMHAKIIVVPSVHFAVCEKDGTYTIKDVPAGKYKVTAWSNGCEKKTTEVTVAEKTGATTEFALAVDAKSQAAAPSGDKQQADASDKK